MPNAELDLLAPPPSSRFPSGWFGGGQGPSARGPGLQGRVRSAESCGVMRCREAFSWVSIPGNQSGWDFSSSGLWPFQGRRFRYNPVVLTMTYAYTEMHTAPDTRSSKRWAATPLVGCERIAGGSRFISGCILFLWDLLLSWYLMGFGETLQICSLFCSVPALSNSKG